MADRSHLALLLANEQGHDDNNNALNVPLLLSPDDEDSFWMINTTADNTTMLQQLNDDHDPVQQHRRRQRQYMAMLSNFSTSYNVVNISLVLPILKTLYANADQTTNPDDAALVASTLLAGMMVGQLIGGALGDVVGRLRALIFVMALQVLASLASAFCVSSKSSLQQLYLILAVWRFVLGVGCGGVYPLAAVLSAEQDDDDNNNNNNHNNMPPLTASPQPTRTRGRHQKDHSLHRVVLTFSMQGVGFWTAAAMGVFLLYTCHDNLNLVWRFLLGLGSVPGIILMYAQWRQGRRQGQQVVSPVDPLEVEPVQHHSSVTHRPDNDRDSFTNDDAGSRVSPPEPVQHGQPNQEENENGNIDDNVDSDGDGESTVLDSSADMNDVIFVTDEEIRESQSWWHSIRHEPDLCRKMLGTALTWFLFDILFYGNTLFQPIVLEAAFGAQHKIGHDDSIQLLRETATDSFLLTSIALPGYIIAGVLMGQTTCGIQQTPRYVMLQGFAAMSLLYLIIGLFWTDLRQFPFVLVTLYGLTFFFANYGPNTTTFVLPSLVYSHDCRSTLNGVSAAAGKFGAWTGASLFEPAAERFGDAAVMLICAGVAVLAFLLTSAFVRIPSTARHEYSATFSPSSAEPHTIA